MTNNDLELADEVHDEIIRLCKTGDSLAEARNFEDAIAEYNKAWKLLPDPKNNWEAATWILAAIADSCYLDGKNGSARQALEYAMICPGALGNPFLHFRLGQVLLDVGEEDAAADELMRAYMGAGEDIFKADDPKYLKFLKTRAVL